MKVKPCRICNQPIEIRGSTKYCQQCKAKLSIEKTIASEKACKKSKRELTLFGQKKEIP